MNSASISILVAAGSIMAAASVAQANCQPLLEALEEMGNQERVAFCLVDNRAECLMADGTVQGDQWINGNPMTEVAKDLREQDVPLGQQGLWTGGGPRR